MRSLIAVVAALVAVRAQKAPRWLSAVRDGSGVCCDVESGNVSGAMAIGAYTSGVEETGWDVMDITTDPALSAADAGFAAGIIEGFATQPRIYAAFENFVAFFFKNTNRTVANGCVLSFVEEQTVWMDEMAVLACTKQAVLGSPDNCTYWSNVAASVAQARGIWAGYLLASPADQALSWHQVYQLANAGDLEDLLNAFPDSKCPIVDRPSWRDVHASRDGAPTPPGFQAPQADAPLVPVTELQDPYAVPPLVRSASHCSGFLRYVPSTRTSTGATASAPQLLSGHTTFNQYPFMLRVYKMYRMRLPGVVAELTSFSARPGDLHSKDDFYLLSSNLTVMETSLSVFDRSIYSVLTPLSVPCWIRTSAANRLAASAPEWAEIFSRYPSGTHNNDWIVGDWNALPQGSEAPTNLAWRVEEMPGVVEAWDATPNLIEAGFLFSVNIPNNSVIFNVSGYNATGYNLKTDPRANIFRRDGPGVLNISSLQALMTSNNYKTDPFAKGNPCNAISARCDLPGAAGTTHNPYTFGGIDCKLADNARMAPKPQGPTARVQSAPTHLGGAVPVFSFANWSQVEHAGMPETWPFVFEELTSMTSGLWFESE
jgi:hypothetical protein